MVKVTKKEFINSSLWKIVEQFSTKGISLLFSIILTRMLSPSSYGLIALTAVFTNLSDILIDGGFSTALIRKKEVDDCDFSCVLVVSLSIATILYIVMFILAPAISVYYREPQLTSVLRIIGLMLFIQAFSAVRTAIVNRNMQFKLLFRCNLLGTVVSGIIGVIAASLGWGVWALVLQRLLQLALSILFLALKMNFKINFHFDFIRLKEIMKFSIGVVGASLINYLSSSFYSLLVGKKYSVIDLGYSDKGAQLPTQVSLYTFGAMSSVLLPTLASYQSDISMVKKVVRKVFQMTSYLIAPMMVGLALVSEEVIVILFTDNWLPAVPIMQANCLYYLATPFMLISVQVFYALGYSRSRVKTELVRMVFQVVGVTVFGLIIGCNIGQLAWVIAIVAVLSAIVTFLEVRSMIGYKIVECLKDIYLPILAAIGMGMAIIVLDRGIIARFSFESNILSLLLKVSCGGIIYLLLSIVCKMNGFVEVKHIFDDVKRRKNE